MLTSSTGITPSTTIILLLVAALATLTGAAPEVQSSTAVVAHPLLQTLLEHPAVEELVANVKVHLERWWADLWHSGGPGVHGPPAQPLALFAAVGAALSVVTAAIKGALFGHGHDDADLLQDATAAVMDAVASGECLERAACHLGHLVRGHAASEAAFK